MTVRFTLQAQDDLRNILAYIDNASPTAAERVRAAIADTLALIAARPGIGIGTARHPQLRSFLMLRYPYRIHHVVENADILIVHVRHSARRPWNAAWSR